MNSNKKVATFESRIEAPIWKCFDAWASRMFYASGALMLVQVVLIGLIRYEIASFSNLWIAPAGVAALGASIIGLIGLYPRLSAQSPRLACVGVGAAVLAGLVLCVAAAWLIGAGLLGGGIPEPPPGWFFALIGVFMIAIVLALIFSAVAVLFVRGSTRIVGYLLLVPVFAWGLILAVGAVTGLDTALSLDFYTNGIIAIAFLAVGYYLHVAHGS